MTVSGPRRSLWAVPCAADSAALGVEIDRLARLAGGPRFAPHVTLLGAVPDAASVDTVAGVVSRLPAIPARFTELADSDDKFRCLTLEAAPSAALLRLRASLAAALGLDGLSPFEPHLSLLYGELPPATRAELRATVTLTLPTSTILDAVWLVDTSADDAAVWSIEETWRLSPA